MYIIVLVFFCVFVVRVCLLHVINLTLLDFAAYGFFTSKGAYACKGDFSLSPYLIGLNVFVSVYV